MGHWLKLRLSNALQSSRAERITEICLFSSCQLYPVCNDRVRRAIAWLIDSYSEAEYQNFAIDLFSFMIDGLC